MHTLRSLAPFASPGTTTAGSVVVRDGEGAHLAEARRRGSGDRARWRWSATDPDLGTFVVEPGIDDRSWLVTRTDGAPFGELHVRGTLRRRLEVTDGRGSHVEILPSGTVRGPDGTTVARVTRDGDARVRLAVLADLDPTWQTLLLAACLVRPGN